VTFHFYGGLLFSGDPAAPQETAREIGAITRSSSSASVLPHRLMEAPAKLKKIPKESTSGKREKFVQLAQSRTVNAIKAIRVIGKLGNKAHYEYDEKDVKKIAGALTKEIEALKARMSDQGGKAEVEFTL
jgi:hypothetical protein